MSSHIHPLNRRDLIRVGGAGLLGMNLPRLLRAEDVQQSAKKKPGRAKSVIFLFQWGGPSHVDMFDRAESEIEFWTRRVEEVKKYTRDQAIAELISALKLKEKIKSLRKFIRQLPKDETIG